MSHCDLVNSLAKHFICPETIVFTEPVLGGIVNGTRPDVIVVDRSYTRTNIRIYEVKHSQSDFDSDLRSQKWEKYLPYCDRFFFALDSKIKWKDRLAAQPVGVLLCQDDVWKLGRRSPKNPHRQPWHQDDALSLMFNLAKREDSASIRRNQHELELERLRSEDLRELQFVADEFLSNKAQDLVKREHAVKGIEENSRKQVLVALNEALLGDKWFFGSTIGHFVEHLVMDHIESTIREHIKTVSEKIRDIVNTQSEVKNA